MVEDLHQATGVSRAEIIRRAVRYALSQAKDRKSLDFLFGDAQTVERALRALNVDTDSRSLLPTGGTERRAENPEEEEEEEDRGGCQCHLSKN